MLIVAQAIFVSTLTSSASWESGDLVDDESIDSLWPQNIFDSSIKLQPIDNLEATNQWQMIAQDTPYTVTSANFCAARLKPSVDTDCPDIVTSENCTEVSFKETFAASGTILVAYSRSLVCCSAAATLSAPTNDQCPFALTAVVRNQSLDANVRVGPFTQMYRPDIHLFVAEFCSFPSPLLGIGIALVLSVCLHLWKGRTYKCGSEAHRDNVVDGARSFFFMSLEAGALYQIAGELHIYTHGLEIDYALLLSTIAQIVTCVTMQSKKENFLNNARGLSFVKDCMKKSSIMTIIFALSGSFASVVPVVQKALEMLTGAPKQRTQIVRP